MFIDSYKSIGEVAFVLANYSQRGLVHELYLLPLTAF